MLIVLPKAVSYDESFSKHKIVFHYNYAYPNKYKVYFNNSLSTFFTNGRAYLEPYLKNDSKTFAIFIDREYFWYTPIDLTQTKRDIARLKISKIDKQISDLESEIKSQVDKRDSTKNIIEEQVRIDKLANIDEEIKALKKIKVDLLNDRKELEANLDSDEIYLPYFPSYNKPKLDSTFINLYLLTDKDVTKDYNLFFYDNWFSNDSIQLIDDNYEINPKYVLNKSDFEDWYQNGYYELKLDTGIVKFIPYKSLAPYKSKKIYEGDTDFGNMRIYDSLIVENLKDESLNFLELFFLCFTLFATIITGLFVYLSFSKKINLIDFYKEKKLDYLKKKFSPLESEKIEIVDLIIESNGLKTTPYFKEKQNEVISALSNLSLKLLEVKKKNKNWLIYHLTLVLN